MSDQIDENMGGFQCVPRLFREYDSWKLSQPSDRDKFKPDVSDFKNEIIKVPLKKGDLLIFNSLLPHGIRPNLSKNKIRIAQYVSMFPSEENNEALKEWRIKSLVQKNCARRICFSWRP